MPGTSKPSRSWLVTTTVFACVLLLALLGGANAFSLVSRRNFASPKGPQVCSPKDAQPTCILGCFKCARAFGRKTYNTTACCMACLQTQAFLVDDGPEFCSSRFVAAARRS